MLRRVAAACSPLLRSRAVSTLASRVTDEQKSEFLRDGVTVVRGAFTAWVDRLREAAEVNLAHPGPLCDEHVPAGQPGRFHDDQFLWKRHPTFRDFVFDSQLACSVASAPSASIFYDQLFVKEPGTNKPTPWHNDHSYWHVRGGRVLTLWVPLDVLPGAMAVRYVAGSHRWGVAPDQPEGTKYRIKSFSDEQARYAATADWPEPPDVDAMEAAGTARVLSFDMQPGDALVFDSYTVHGSSGNLSQATRRRAYATRWATDGCVFDARPSTMHHTWAAKGLDAELTDGAPLAASALHPAIPMAPPAAAAAAA